MHITKKGDGVYNIKCSISAYNTTTREAWIYLEIDKITKNKLQSSIESTGAKGVDIIPFSSNMLGQRKTIDEESASALKSVYDFSNKHGWILVTRGTPSVDLSPESPGQTLSPETMRRQEEDVLVQERVAEENPGDFNTGEKRDIPCSAYGGEEVHKKQRTAAVPSIGVNAFTPMISELLSASLQREDDARRREMELKEKNVTLKEKYKAKLAALQEKNDTLVEAAESQCANKTAQKRKYKAKLAALQEKYDTLKAETPVVHASEFQGSNEATDAEKDRMLAKLDAENQELQERLIANISDRDNLRARLEAEIESLLTRLDTRAATNANLQARLDAKENDITAGASEYNRRIAALEQNVSDLRAEKEANNADYLLCAADLEERIGRLEAENSSFRDKLRILKAFLDSV